MQIDRKTCIRAAVTIFLLYLAIQYWNPLIKILGMGISAASPLFLGAVIAYIVNILMSFYEERKIWKKANLWMEKIKRPLCMILAFLTIILVVVLLINMILPELIACFQVLFNGLPKAVNQLINWIESNLDVKSFLNDGKTLDQLKDMNIQEYVTKAGNVLLNGFGGAMGSVVSLFSTFFSKAVTVLVALVFSVYILLGKETLGGQCQKLLKTYTRPKFQEKFLYVLGVFHQSFHSFIVGQCIEAIILGVLCTLGMLLFRFPYATMIGCLVGFTALIPVAGAYIGAIVGAFMIFTVSPIQALLFLVYLVVLQQLEGNIIYPRVVGASIGLPGIWVLAAVTIGGGVLGVGGMLLGVPIAAALYQLLRADMRKRNTGKNGRP